jgi:putative ABC transport system permease protein
VVNVSALTTKLLRELQRLKGQIATIALVLASGLVSFVSLRGTYTSLAQALDTYYARTSFAHVFAHVERAPLSMGRTIEALPGVQVLELRLQKEVTVPLEGLSRAAYARLLSLPSGRASRVNTLVLRQGRLPEPQRTDEVVVLEAFARAHGLEAGHRIPVVINGAQRQLHIVGIALSPEFVFAIRPGSLVDDPKRYAVLWMNEDQLAHAFGMAGVFNDLALRLQPGASASAVRLQLDRLLEPHGGTGAFERDDQVSHRIVSQELSQLRALAGMIPIVFLGVAAFLINLVLARLIRLQRSEIATLKAIGYPNRRIGNHYLGLVLVVLVPGSLLGIAGGLWLGELVLGLYSGIFRFPDLTFEADVSLLAIGVGASGVSAVLGALGAVRSAVRLPPAEAMRPPAPARYRPGLIEKLRLAQVLGPSGLMVFREIQRRPLRSALSSLGIAGAAALLILGRFGWDSLTAYFEGTFRRAHRQDFEVAFFEPLPPRVVTDLMKYPGVIRAEGVRTLAVRARHDHRRRDVALVGLSPEGSLRQLVAMNARTLPVPAVGVSITETLGELLGVGVGDTLDLELLQGDRRTLRVPISASFPETTGLQVYASTELLAQLIGDLGAVSSVLLQVDTRHSAELQAALKRSPQVLDVADVRGDMQRLFDMNARVFNVWTLVSITLAASVVFGVVYNNARIALAARSRELASLRVLGLTRREISLILLGGLAFEVVVALPIGLFLGRMWARQFMSTVDQETFRWQVVIAPSTTLLVICVVLLASAASAFWVRMSLDKLNLIEVLKARE